jgi:hypothetical protein
MSARRRPFMVAGRLSGRDWGAGGGALDATDDQGEHDYQLQHSILRLPPSFTLLISPFTGFRGIARGGSFMLDCK